MKRNSLYKLILRRRSIRLFKQKKIPLAVIKKVINAARAAPSAGNRQFLEYLAVDNKNLVDKIFSCLRWAAYLWPMRTPPPNRRPLLYIIILVNKGKTKKADLRDVGAACENILISLSSFGLGGCWLASIERKKLRRILEMPPIYAIDSLIAAGFPAESPKLETDSQNIKYWLDKNNRLHVPKRALKDIFHYNVIE